jgi:hypothetical protein
MKKYNIEDTPEFLRDYIFTPYFDASPPYDLLEQYDSLSYAREVVGNNLLIIPPSFNHEVLLSCNKENCSEHVLKSSSYFNKIEKKMDEEGYRFTPKETLRVILDLNERTYFHIREIIVSQLKWLYVEEPERKLKIHKWKGIVDVFENIDTIVIEYLENNMYADDSYLKGVTEISLKIRKQNNMPIHKKFKPLLKAFGMEETQMYQV